MSDKQYVLIIMTHLPIIKPNAFLYRLNCVLHSKQSP